MSSTKEKEELGGCEERKRGVMLLPQVEVCGRRTRTRIRIVLWGVCWRAVCVVCPS